MTLDQARHKIFLLRAEHFSSPGLVIKTFATRAGADAEAAALVNIMLKDAGWWPSASRTTWRLRLSELQAWDDHDFELECYVQIDELDVLP